MIIVKGHRVSGKTDREDKYKCLLSPIVHTGRLYKGSADESSSLLGIFCDRVALDACYDISRV
jgi:hypothetical protein